MLCLAQVPYYDHALDLILDTDPPLGKEIRIELNCYLISLLKIN